MTDLRKSGERCVLCLEEKRSPVRIQCGHSFCCSCFDIYKSCKNYPWANKCPICRNVLKETKSVHWSIYLLLSILLIVLCTAPLTTYSFITEANHVQKHFY